mmetsp:Transcript_58360/g.123778  ORF Transcript_58360/g.123778 Transcript_58360/m.123778 type:complete len:231 (+) Transcript_58360:404-1096(+)
MRLGRSRSALDDSGHGRTLPAAWVRNHSVALQVLLLRRLRSVPRLGLVGQSRHSALHRRGSRERPDSQMYKFFCGSSFSDIQTDTCAGRQWCPTPTAEAAASAALSSGGGSGAIRSCRRGAATPPRPPGEEGTRRRAAGSSSPSPGACTTVGGWYQMSSTCTRWWTTGRPTRTTTRSWRSRDGPARRPRSFRRIRRAVTAAGKAAGAVDGAGAEAAAGRAVRSKSRIGRG